MYSVFEHVKTEALKSVLYSQNFACVDGTLEVRSNDYRKLASHTLQESTATLFHSYDVVTGMTQ